MLTAGAERESVIVLPLPTAYRCAHDALTSDGQRIKCARQPMDTPYAALCWLLTRLDQLADQVETDAIGPVRLLRRDIPEHGNALRALANGETYSLSLPPDGDGTRHHFQLRQPPDFDDQDRSAS
ncbi:hypothetical protein QMK19_39785 [Streptomyces sp. H10-C2]|uniref:hypothetical protein n=1 Tax=unclassified Streptomyces TaxID=2593676 RepID=UPI0024B96F14|nr:MULTISPECIES: hypothetical protein [unclassified Streptomyces]MDJ0347355.1 hypothetical protein [Streptomyces sp. PH10-H1]MDJ0375565.1 hypothetical protein [Streptomyces sp. H10-C2]